MLWTNRGSRHINWSFHFNTMWEKLLWIRRYGKSMRWWEHEQAGPEPSLASSKKTPKGDEDLAVTWGCIPPVTSAESGREQTFNQKSMKEGKEGERKIQRQDWTNESFLFPPKIWVCTFLTASPHFPNRFPCETWRQSPYSLLRSFSGCSTSRYT